MKLQELFEGKLEKAGFVPYVVENGVPLFYFMISSDPAYGGPDPAIAKGRVDPGETAERAAFREGTEELGLRRSNIVPGTIELGWKGEITGKLESYPMTVYIGEVKSKTAFDEPDFEVGDRRWLTLAEFEKVGTKGQLKIVQALHEKLAK